MSWDHRAVDGAYVSSFLRQVAELLGTPRLGLRALGGRRRAPGPPAGPGPLRRGDDLQRALAARAADDYLLLLEHPHVYTMGVPGRPGPRAGRPGPVGAALVRTDRGGDVTYHGPGQLVVYPIVTVRRRAGGRARHVHRLEQLVIDALGDLGVATPRRRRPAGGLSGASGSGPSGDRPARWRRSGAHAAAADGATQDPARPGPQRRLRPVDVRPHRALRHPRPAGDLAGRRGRRRRASWTVAEPCGPRGRCVGRLRGRPPGSRCTAGPPRRTPAAGGERPLLRRLRQAGWPSRRRACGSANRLAPGPGPDGRGLPEPRPDDPRPRSGHGLRGGGLSEHLRVLGRGHGDVHGQRRPVHPCLRVLPGRHPPPPAARSGRAGRVAEAVARMRLAHAVVTCVARDDLADGGAGAIAATVEASAAAVRPPRSRFSSRTARATRVRWT